MEGSLWGSCVLSYQLVAARSKVATMSSRPFLISRPIPGIPFHLSPSAGKEHRAVMLQHLETIQVIMNALVEEDYELARGLTELHLGFFMYRLSFTAQPQARQDALFPRRVSSPRIFHPPITTWPWRIMRRLKSWRGSFPRKT